MLTVVVARWSSGGPAMLCTSGFVDGVMLSHNRHYDASRVFLSGERIAQQHKLLHLFLPNSAQWRIHNYSSWIRTPEEGKVCYLRLLCSVPYSKLTPPADATRHDGRVRRVWRCELNRRQSAGSRAHWKQSSNSHRPAARDATRRNSTASDGVSWLWRCALSLDRVSTATTTTTSSSSSSRWWRRRTICSRSWAPRSNMCSWTGRGCSSGDRRRSAASSASTDASTTSSTWSATANKPCSSPAASTARRTRAESTSCRGTRDVETRRTAVCSRAGTSWKKTRHRPCFKPTKSSRHSRPSSL